MTTNEWSYGLPVQTDTTNYEWSYGTPYIITELAGVAHALEVTVETTSSILSTTILYQGLGLQTNATTVLTTALNILHGLGIDINALTTDEFNLVLNYAIAVQTSAISTVTDALIKLQLLSLLSSSCSYIGTQGVLDTGFNQGGFNLDSFNSGEDEYRLRLDVAAALAIQIDALTTILSAIFKSGESLNVNIDAVTTVLQDIVQQHGIRVGVDAVTTLLQNLNQGHALNVNIDALSNIIELLSLIQPLNLETGGVSTVTFTAHTRYGYPLEITVSLSDRTISGELTETKRGGKQSTTKRASGLSVR
jgi:hypothetical protein